MERGRSRRTSLAAPRLTGRLEQRWELPNGVRLIAHQIPSAYSVTLGIWVVGGSCDEEPDYNGTAHMLEHLLAGSSQRHTARQLALAFERLGTEVNAYTTKELTCYHAQTLPDRLPRVLQLLTEQLFSPRLNQRLLARERRVITEELLAYADDPEELLYEHAERLLFENHPLGMPIAGTPESVQRITLGVLQDFHRRFYVGERIVVTLVGNLPPEEALRAAAAVFADIPRQHCQLPARVPPQPQRAREETLCRPFQQASLLIARLLPRLSAPERTALAILNFVLGEGWGSRLYQRLRERHGLVYNITSELEWYSTCGVWSISASTSPGTLPRVEELIFEELRHLSNGGIRPEEFERGRAFLHARLAMALDSPAECMTLLARAALEQEPTPLPELLELQLSQLSRDTVDMLAALYCQPGDWSRVRLLPSNDA